MDAMADPRRPSVDPSCPTPTGAGSDSEQTLHMGEYRFRCFAEVAPVGLFETDSKRTLHLCQ